MISFDALAPSALIALRSFDGHRDQPARSRPVVMELIRITAVNCSFPPDSAIPGVARGGNEEPGRSRRYLQKFGIPAAVP